MMIHTLNLVYIYLSIIHLTKTQQPLKTAHLKPSSISTLSGISVTTGPGATTINDKWNINVVTQQGSDLTISLNEEWSFDPIHPSSIQLYMQGITSNSSYDHDGEIVFVFNVNDQYFAQVISLDTRKTAYKECPNSNTPLITRDINDMINSLLPDRYHRFCKNPSGTPINDGIDYWNNVASVYKQPAKWPMWITILNNPTTDTISYRWTDSIAGINLVSSRYTGTFNTNQGLNMHISGESPYEQFFIFSIDVTYRIYIPQPTNNPTLSPTNNPTFPPTKIPSQKPTQNPTNVPTKIPTFIPTKFPSQKPTQNPSNNPSNIPTNNPTYKPSNNPSFIPTKYPTNNPTYKPTTNPSNIPSISPTPSPIKSPTINPTYIPTNYPSYTPSNNPTITPTYIPSNNPTISPTNNPTFIPTNNPTISPTLYPTLKPFKYPTKTPSGNPTPNPTPKPTPIPSPYPTSQPSIAPSIEPTLEPTLYPSIYAPIAPISYSPTDDPTNIPTIYPTNVVNTTNINSIIYHTETNTIITVTKMIRNLYHKPKPKEPTITWFHTIVIICGVFIFFIGLIVIFSFSYATHTNSNHEEIIEHDNNGTQGEQSGTLTPYQSESALIHKPISQLLNINMNVPYEGSSRKTSYCSGTVTPNEPMLNDSDMNDDDINTIMNTDTDTSDTDGDLFYQPGNKVTRRKNTESIESIDI